MIAQVIAHVDMDAFYVSVELVKRPELRGQPVIVANGSGRAGRRGVVMAASYEAREHGVHSALPNSIARRRCPQAVWLPSDMALYRRASKAVMEVLSRFSDRIEVAGLDEAYLDLSGSLVPTARARELKAAVTARTRLVCSVGLAPNKLLAKIASDLEKPDGLCVLRAEDLLARVGDRAARIIPGVGPRTEERLAAVGISTLAELASASDAALTGALGPRLGLELRERANGVDRRPLVTNRIRKSESRETTFGDDVTDREQLADTVDRLARSVCDGLSSVENAGRTVTLKIRLRGFKTHTRSRTLEAQTADGDLVSRVARDLLERFDPAEPVRLIGVGLSGLRSAEAPPQNDESDPAAAAPEGGAAEPLTLDVG